jgi:phenylacetate-CoA ligase
MNEKLASGVYARLPVFAQNLAASAYGWREARVRFGPEFRRRLDALTASDRWSRADMDAYQDEQVALLIRHAYEHVPFYRERMRALGLTPADVRSRADLPKLPVLTKEEVRANLPRLKAANAPPKALRHSHTSGTTGKSLDFYVTDRSLAFQWAVWWRHRRRFGLEFGMRHANFTGKLIVPPSQRKPPFWRWNRAFNQALLNMQHITPDKVGAIVDFLGRHDFVFWGGYPSIIHALVRTAMEAGVKLERGPRIIDTGAENMLDVQRRDIEAFTGALLTDQYGFSEGCGNASHCERLAYHEDVEYGVLECGDPETLPDGRVRGTILATGFACPEFPFIRYEVGDAGVWEPGGHLCPCGRQHRILARIEGREDDYVLTPEGGRVMRFDYVFKDTHNVRECQVVQERLGEVVLKVVRRPGYSAADERFIVSEMHRWISPTLQVRFDYVDEIPRDRTGKFRAVRSLLRRGAAASAGEAAGS